MTDEALDEQIRMRTSLAQMEWVRAAAARANDQPAAVTLYRAAAEAHLAHQRELIEQRRQSCK